MRSEPGSWSRCENHASANIPLPCAPAHHTTGTSGQVLEAQE